jgi:hypothetical protein
MRPLVVDQADVDVPKVFAPIRQEAHDVVEDDKIDPPNIIISRRGDIQMPPGSAMVSSRVAIFTPSPKNVIARNPSPVLLTMGPPCSEIAGCR